LLLPDISLTEYDVDLRVRGKVVCGKAKSFRTKYVAVAHELENLAERHAAKETTVAYGL
jgi:hypothetical protein